MRIAKYIGHEMVGISHAKLMAMPLEDINGEFTITICGGDFKPALDMFNMLFGLHNTTLHDYALQQGYPFRFSLQLDEGLRNPMDGKQLRISVQTIHVAEETFIEISMSLHRCRPSDLRLAEHLVHSNDKNRNQDSIILYGHDGLETSLENTRFQVIEQQPAICEF